MNRHRIEIFCKNADGMLEVIGLTIEADMTEGSMTAFGGGVRRILEDRLAIKPPETIEHWRDYPLPPAENAE